MGVTTSKARRDMLTYLDKKSDDPKETERQQIELKREELELNKARFELEAKQRDASVDKDRRERAAGNGLEA